MNTETIENIKEQVAFVLNEYHEKGGRYFYDDNEINEIIEDVFLKNKKVKNSVDVYKEEDGTTTVEIKYNFAVLIIEYVEKWKDIHVKLTGEYTFESYKNRNGEYFEGMILE